MFIPDLYKPIRNMGYLFVIIGCYGLFVLFTKLCDADHFFIVFLFAFLYGVFLYGFSCTGSGHSKLLVLKELYAYFGLKKGLYRTFWGQKGRYRKKLRIL